MKNKQSFWVLTLVATIGIMIVIVFFSSQSAEESNALSEGLAEILLERFPALSKVADLNLLNHWLRKAAHFCLYFLLGCSMTAAAGRQTRILPAVLSIAVGIVFAASDEIHQFFSDQRVPMVRDVLLDTAGVAAGTWFVLFCSKLFGKRKRSAH